jgi:beta-phosphoglucomutase-like phosphatase (HAD superfamily)
VDPLKAVIFDVDGTLAETERDGHRVAFNLAFHEYGLPWRWDEVRYGQLLRIAGGRERILHDMTSQPSAPALTRERLVLARAVHVRKNAIYADLVAGTGAINLRPGVRRLLEQCLDCGVRMAIATTTSRANLDALLLKEVGPRWRDWFPVAVCGEDVASKKPHPEVYERALDQLRVGALQVVAVEDSPGGVAASRASDVPVIVTRSAYFQTAQIEGALAIGPGLHQRDGWFPPAPLAGSCDGIGLQDIDHWRFRMETPSRFD